MEKYLFDPSIQSALEIASNPFGIYQFMDDKRILPLVLSAGFCDLFGFDSTAEAYDVMTNNLYRDTHPDDLGRVADEGFRFATEDGEYNIVYRTWVRRSQAYVVVHARGKHLMTKNGTRISIIWYMNEGLYSDSAQDHEDDLSHSFNTMLREGSLIRQSYYDTLTGLPNMAHFFELADAARSRFIKEEKPAALLFFDLCGMKLFNQRYGFSEGDSLLRHFAEILTRHYSNDSCGRFGQDHFAAYVEAVDIEDTLREIFRECESMNGGKTLPIRVGIYPDRMDGQDISGACDKAKYACDSARDVYSSVYRYFDETMLARIEQRQYILDHFDQALAERWIKVYYQPIIRAASGKVCDEEALSRWLDPAKGMLSPGEFIPTLEDSKQIYKLDLYVLDRTLEKMRAQSDAGLYIVPQSVNLSRTDFEMCDMVEEICRRVDAAGIARDKLTIEITESVVGSNFDFIKKQVARFQSQGFQVWMDDFGSGYSSLDVLQSIHFDLIKFDMHFMQQFDKGDEGKIILTELIKMAIGLGIDTVAEGVETLEQVEFLREVGCTKLQGFYYCRAIPLEEIVERNRRGIQIGYENPEETEYYAALGRINLYDLGALAREDRQSFSRYFDTIPMAIIETTADAYALIRCNQSYRDFMTKMFGIVLVGQRIAYAEIPISSGLGFLNAMRECGLEGGQMIIDEELGAGTVVHALLKRIAVNPVTGMRAVAVAVLAISDGKNQSAGITYAQLSKALSADYFSLYYVDMDTEHFDEYSSAAGHTDIAVERHGENFFATARTDAIQFIYEDDRETVINALTKENVVRALDAQGSFTLTYRLLVDGAPIYVNMKAVRVQSDGSHIIIGINNVDAQMREKEALERIREERTTYARISALSGDYICIYTVDPRTDHYIEYSATRDYEGLGLAKEGDDFFRRSHEDSVRAIFPEDRGLFQAAFIKENVLKEIERSGLFVLQYRLMIEGEPVYVNVKAAMVEEKDGPQLIIGVNNVDAQVKKDQEYAQNLSIARAKANLDALTGVKNANAFVEAEARLDSSLRTSLEKPYAIVLFDVSGLKKLNADQGVEAGDLALRQACSVICNIFKRSPVFRIKGGEFAVITQGHDYELLDDLLADLARREEKDAVFGSTSVAYGMARSGDDESAATVVDRANEKLREHRQHLKEN